MNSRERSPSTDKWDITYIEFQYLVKNLCLKIMESGESFDVISPVMRGGMAPALWISHILNIPVRVELEANKKVLVLDDVGDTGKTLRGIERTHTHLDYKVGVLVKKLWCIPEPDFYGVEDNRWAVFPWEIDLYD